MSHDHCRPHTWPGQLTSGDKYGSYNCAAYALAKGLEFDTCGVVNRTGADIRRLSNEPVPDWSSPGLHHGQLRDVAAKFGVRLELLAGAPWDEVADATRRGFGVLLAVNYLPIRTTSYSGQRSFYGNHELFLMPEWFTYDSLCDGRLSNGTRVFRGPAVYPESLLKNAAGAFVLERYPSGAIKRRLGYGRAVAAVLPRAHPLTEPVPPPVTPPYSTSEKNVAILTAYKGHTFRMAKGTPIYRSPSGPKVTELSKDGSVEYIGRAGGGWVGIRVATSALYSDGIARPTVLYVPSGAGTLE